MCDRYKLSFTAASLALAQSVTIAQVYLDCSNWADTRKKVLDENLLGLRSPKSSVRVYRELQCRLAPLSDEEILLLVRGESADRKALLWRAFCSRYELVRRWAQQVIVPRFRLMDRAISSSDVYAFLSREAIDHPEIEDLADSTREKLVTVLLRTMREAGIVSKDHTILPAVLSPGVKELMCARCPDAMSVFPLLPGQAGG